METAGVRADADHRCIRTVRRTSAIRRCIVPEIPTTEIRVRILLLCSSFNGLTQRVWTDLRADGHDVTDADGGLRRRRARSRRRHRPGRDHLPVPEGARARRRVAHPARPSILHPGPEGDRGPSSLDWAISDGEPEWGVTALGAIDEMDAGPIWGTRTFALPGRPATQERALRRPGHRGCRRAGPRGRGEGGRPDVRAAAARLLPPRRPRPAPADHAPGRPGLLVVGPARRTCFAASAPPTAPPASAPSWPGSPYRCSTRTADPRTPGKPGTIALRRQGAVLVRTGDGALWIGHLRRVRHGGGPRIKLPATMVLGDRLAGVPESLELARHADAHGRGSRDLLPPARPGRRRQLRLLQRCDVHRAVPPAGGGAAGGGRPGHLGAGAARRRSSSPTASTSTSSRPGRTPPRRRGGTSTRSTTSVARSSPAPTSSSSPRWAATRGRRGDARSRG